MKFDSAWAKVILTCASLVIIGLWTYFTWCVGQVVKAYKERSKTEILKAELIADTQRSQKDVLALEMKMLSRRLGMNESLLVYWERSISKMQADLVAAERRMGERTKERDTLRDALETAENALEAIRQSDDPLKRYAYAEYLHESRSTSENENE